MVSESIAIFLHHVSIEVRDLVASVAFYTQVIGLRQVDRPAFPSSGAWLDCAGQQVHLNHKPEMTPQIGRRFDPTGPHFALRCADFDAAVIGLRAAGYDEHAADEQRRLIIHRTGLAGFAQLFLFDPDWNLVETNAA